MAKKRAVDAERAVRCSGCGVAGEKPLADSLSLPRGWVFELRRWPGGGQDLAATCALCQGQRWAREGGAG